MMDLIGEKFGKLTPVSYDYSKSIKNPFVLCKCDCGEIKIVQENLLKRGIAKSCGCRRKEHAEELRSINTTHGFKNDRLHLIWSGIVKRCNEPKNGNYYKYGARGISVCDEWSQSAEKFILWSVSNGYAQGLSIERINNDGNYEPGNCKWATPKEQSRNRRSNIRVEINGKEKTLIEWSEDLNIKPYVLYRRYSLGDRGEHLFR